ncbi:DUF1659 domain-containing protein [Staphylococcus pseudintermedius]|uniref:sigS mRNA-stabilizing protein SroA n=1 Tax=Staphylococcus pseudintermedius TaxID=283734 RepID=UPI0018E118D5|nr:DUF1659 domain-containing protein [Staphylococcus pseudintermedius]EGQ3293222.1 DUF1659 domain-containing protein [Staphylococcus pseudintermedius]EGQ3834225.1 DUF1659 domain-containing protein [Staphylococcus pseudintermedius]EGQ4133431.1 DUF1659 domain-containing protein [Staphylococcus pseudintermedius]EHA6116070.1 DUF1659 domain-containing protein [Staphylococcus pseudintermedius]EHK9622722.1 DUF1659 domain-containing protein [Staphylococcus pseudintermedius]
MNINHLTLILTQTTTSAERKPKKASRRFTQLKTDASHEDLKAFSQMIEKLTGEQYDAIELMTSENIQ